MALSYLVEDHHHGDNGDSGDNGAGEEPFDVVQANLSMNSNQSHDEHYVDDEKKQSTVSEDEYDTRRNNHSSKSKSSSGRVPRSRTPTNEVGDLPTLSKNNNNIDMVSDPPRVTGGRSASLRPLSPPSRAGLDDPAVYNSENMSRSGGGSTTVDETLSTSGGHDSYTRGSTSRGGVSTLDGHDYDDDDDRRQLEDAMMIPMDELQTDKSMEETVQQDAGLCALSGDDPTAAFCDATLAEMAEMCGLPPPSDRQKRSDAVVAAAMKRKALALGEKHSLGRAGGVEEQTAIEVEYVEPAYRGKDGGDAMYNSKQKNELLKAMAKKAKADYEQNRPNSTTNSAGGTTISSSYDGATADGDMYDGDNDTDDAPQENVYASFTAVEKRKFLKLINGGMSPYAATEQVVADRTAAGKEVQTGSDSNEDEEPDQQKAQSSSSTSSSKRRMNLAFWKRKPGKGKDKSKSKSRGATPVTPDGATASTASTPSPGREESREGDGFAVSGIKYYDAVRRNHSYEDDDDDDDDDDYSPTKNNQSADSSRGMRFPKLGFSKLSKANNAVDSDDDDVDVRLTSSTAFPQPTDERHSLSPTVQPHNYVSDDEQTADELARIVGSVPSPQRAETKASDENGILRPVPVKSDGPVSTTREIRHAISEDSLLDDLISQADAAEEKKIEDKMEEAMAAKLLGVSSAAAAATAASSGPPEEEDLERYLTAKTGGSSHHGARSFDQMSVVSGRSHKTSMTSGTNYTTQSTRSRRPGQAKVRIEREKKSNSVRGQRTTGWQESIQAAAAKTGRVWDPEHGWRDYVDPRNQSAQSENELGVDIDVRSIAQSVSYSEHRSSALVDRSYHSEMDQQHQTMVSGAAGEDARSVVSAARSQGSRTPSRRSRKSAAASVGTSPKSTKPTGWVETMKAATANLATDERKWDPEHGWSGVEDSNGMSTEEAEKEAAYMREVAITSESDTQDFGMIQVVPATGAETSAPPKDGSVSQLEAIADNHDSGIQFVAEEEDRAVDEEATAASVFSGRYMQIGDTGSVHSHHRRQSKNQRASQRSPLPLLQQQQAILESPGSGQEIDEVEGSAHTHQSGLTNVKKERIGNEDAGLFPTNKSGRRGSGPVDLDESVPSDADSEEDFNDRHLEVIHRAVASPPSHNKSDSFDGGDSGFGVPPADFSWDADEDTGKAQDSRKPVPKLKVKIRDSSALPPPSPYTNRSMETNRSTGPSSEVSFGSRGSGASSVPKLAAPKRDTSPIRANKSDPPAATENGNNKRSVLSDSVGTASTVPIGRSSGQPGSSTAKDPRVDPSAQDDNDASGEFSDGFYSEITDRTHSSSERPKNMEGVFKTSKNPTPSNEKSKVKSLHSFWEARTASFDSKPSEVLQSSDWKKYLVKKVQSEGSVARRNTSQSSSKMDPEEHFDGPSTPTRNFPASQDNDASGQPRVGAFEDISDLSPIRKEEEESDSEYAPSEASTSIVQGTTFLQRLQACAAPIVNKSTECGPGVPMAAHLAFLRNNPNVGGTTKQSKHAGPPAFCGRPDVIAEEDTIAEEDDEETTERSRGENESRNAKRSKAPRSKSKAGSDVSSVISDEQFGAKNAYLEAIAMKAAVSGGSKKKKRRSGSEVSSESGSSAKHSAQFQKFLERRSASKDTTSDITSNSHGNRLPPKKPPTGRVDSVSARAERYAAKKVEQMMGGDHEDSGRSPEEEIGAFPT
eukprot:CAMPEP_0113506748 /NCGR_PEP_ID=MMETSP0014_2-20120614/36080_1 /TAXON_ID=2857 /ORGANISM="Nitzschia sp." /LENGTH=1702 /DNA_ID=CAMNT_0000402277 /DNA_START=14 /DNA_END=5118 /DNA_ORIENTATION=- /assembly_acc=CAM_ASM_000159